MSKTRSWLRKIY